MVVCGIDEAGRGPIAGPVCAAAVILGPGFDRTPLKDSKVLSPAARNRIAAVLLRDAAVGVGWSWPEEIDRLNIHHASLLAMQRAYEALVSSVPLEPPGKALVDGKFSPPLPITAEAIIKGDAKIPEISAASIIAKVARDRWMIRYSWIEPSWSFETHKGYPTAAHRQLCRLHGLSPIHRRSFKIY
ncbi:MAG: ribonuclease HII [Spirochaetota bacterium]